MKLLKSLAAVAAVIALTSCSPAQFERATQVQPLVAPVAQVQPVTVPAEAAVTFEAIEAVTVEVAPAAAAVAPVEVPEVAEVVTSVAPPAAVLVAPPVADVPAVAPVVPAPVEYAPEPICLQDMPCWDCETMGNFCEDPKDVESVDSPICSQDESCFAPVTAQDWVHEITGNKDLIVREHVGLAWEKGENTCNTLHTVLCEVVFEDGSVAYFIHPDNVGNAGARAAIVEMFS